MGTYNFTRRDLCKVSSLAAASLALPGCDFLNTKSSKTNKGQTGTMSSNYTIACYYFPDYHFDDARNIKLKGKNWSEWELVKNAKPRFKGHQQPKVPLWGYESESDPVVMAKKIDAAADHCIDSFIFDWYWYEDGPFLERALEQGFLKAPNNNRLKFSLMWANHDWKDIHPRTIKVKPRILYPGKISPEVFDKMTDYIIENYFKHPSYWLINGCPYFSIYHLKTLTLSFGNLDATAQALQHFREKTQKAGFAGLHLNAVSWGHQILPGEEVVKDAPQLIKYLGFDSVASYVWIHHVVLNEFPQTPYRYVMNEYFKYYNRAEEQFDVPYYPNVTMGWDASPRCNQLDPFLNKGYPFMPTMSGNTPEAFKEALIRVKERLDQRPKEERIFNINCWNEWTEGSYLEPDTVNKMAYLEAIKEVFCNEGSS